MAYSLDYRRAVAQAYEDCGSSIEVAEQFGCCQSWVRRLIQNRRERGTLNPRSTARHDDQRRYDDADERAIRELIKNRPDATLAEVARAIGKPVHPGTVSRTLRRMNLPRKKKSTHAAEQDRPDVRAARDAWFEQFAQVRVNQLVFLDEFGATTSMQRTHGRAAPGERVVSKVPHGHWKMISTIAAMTIDGIVASGSFDGATDTELFVTFVREALVPVLRPGQVVVLDNLPAHKSPQVDALIRSAGARVLRLPPYSPDFNPIEMAISKVKTMLRKLARRSVDGLFDGIGESLESIRPTDALNYIAHCGYATKRRKPL
jgi:transposase